MKHEFSADFLIIGSGIAGLSFALNVADKGRVLIVTKKHSAESNTNYAQGGIAAVLTPEDSFQEHINDTLVAGAGLCDNEIVEIVVKEGPDRVRELIQLGADFSRRQDGSLHMGREGGHSSNRIVHAADATGREVEQALLHNVAEHPNITILEYYFVVDLLTDEINQNTHCVGAVILNEKSGEFSTVSAPQTLLASGGSGQIYAHTTNPAIATGDGVAMAARAGAAIANMEFFQFHPTALYHPDCKSFLISEALRGEGGILLTKQGHRFMAEYHALAELAPRDVVARAIDDQLKKTGDDCVYLDISHQPSEFIQHHFPTIAKTCLHYGIDITREPIPVVPAAHYQCGGVITNAYGETNVEGLFACGEVAYTGLHGANRLASNSLLEAMVFSYRASKRAQIRPNPASHVLAKSETWQPEPEANLLSSPSISSDQGASEHSIEAFRQQLQHIMWNQVCIIRNDTRLQRAVAALQSLWQNFQYAFPANQQQTPQHIETRNMLITAQLVAQSALMRKESRGLHSTTSHPHAVDVLSIPTIIAWPIDSNTKKAG